ncbi:MAG TPA: dockerin type I domain-containing protein [bacterium]|nr:dockerin type I domain-containing protein [bacterium]
MTFTGSSTAGEISYFTITGGSNGIVCNTAGPLIAHNVITGNNKGTTWGGGIFCLGSNDTQLAPNILHNTISGNSANIGGGIDVFGYGHELGATPWIEGNVIRGNTCTIVGSAIACRLNTNPVSIVNNVIFENTTPSGDKAAVHCFSGVCNIVNNTIVCNNGGTNASAVYAQDGTNGPSVIHIINSIIWDNAGDVKVSTNSTLTLDYCDISDALKVDWGSGNISEDPLFADPQNDDYHLQSEYGRWTAEGWVADDETSPCIDAGDPESAYSLEPLFNGNRANMGAYGNTSQASKSAVGIEIDSDFAVEDESTHSPFFTNSATVTVVSFEIYNEIEADYYAITESLREPLAGQWAETKPTTYTITGEEGHVTLYPWVKDPLGIRHYGDPVSIFFSTATPVVSDFSATNDGGTVEISWATDLPAECSVTYRQVGYTMGSDVTVNEPVGEIGLSTSHGLEIGGVAAAYYQFDIISNETASGRFYGPVGWPTPGDVDFNCKVNVLDLIDIRNRLNADVEDGSNWRCDVNQDGRINVLDLIFVRNRLNIHCAQ